MVNRSLPMFCSEFGPGLDHPHSLSDGQSSASSNTAEKHYSGLDNPTLHEALLSANRPIRQFELLSVLRV
jgi:hypothetical protein